VNAQKPIYLREFETKIKNIFGSSSGAQMVCLAKPLKTKKSHASVLYI
jgi:hypothetical protein